MNNLRNKVSLIGRLGAQPEFTQTEKGAKLVRFSLAINSSYKNKAGERVDETQWMNIKAWGNTADLIHKVLKKGQEVAVEGRLVTNSYETKNGEKRFATDVEINEFLILSPKTDN